MGIAQYFPKYHCLFTQAHLPTIPYLHPIHSFCQNRFIECLLFINRWELRGIQRYLRPAPSPEEVHGLGEDTCLFMDSFTQ